MRYTTYFLLINILILFSDCQSVKSRKTNCTEYTLELIGESLTPLIDNNNPGSVGNKRGYEGGTVFMKDGIYHMFVTEEINGWVGTRTGYWQSKDGVIWERISTIQQSVDKPNDPRNAVWSPMPFYNKNEERWNLFYVGYEKYGQTNGRVFRAISEAKGINGLAGPYSDIPGTVLSYEDKKKDPWEGSQGAAAFFIYKVGTKWYGFYASGDSKSRWDEGLAAADSLEGKWVRDEILNPALTYSENPIVSKFEDNTFFCVFDDIAHGEKSSTIGYAYSPDGVTWIQKTLNFPMPWWAINIRTPQGMIPEAKDTFWVYFTAASASGFDCVGRMKVRVIKSQLKMNK